MSERSQRRLERVPVDDTIYTVYLDSGSFTWLYEILQAKMMIHTWMKPYQALVKRTLLSFDEAYRAANPEAPRKRVLPPKPPPRQRKRLT